MSVEKSMEGFSAFRQLDQVILQRLRERVEQGLDVGQIDDSTIRVMVVPTVSVPSSYEPDRIPRPYADPNCQGGLLEEATEICLRCHRTGPPNQAAEYAHLTGAAARKAGRFAISNLVRPIEERELTRLALRRNVLFSNEAFTKRWIEQGSLGGAENDIYYREGRWVKRNHLNYHTSYLEFFYRLTLQNHFFPSCPVELIGFVRVDGVLKPLFKQTDVEARRGATRDEVEIALAEIGFTRDGG